MPLAASCAGGWASASVGSARSGAGAAPAVPASIGKVAPAGAVAPDAGWTAFAVTDAVAAGAAPAVPAAAPSRWRKPLSIAFAARSRATETSTSLRRPAIACAEADAPLRSVALRSTTMRALSMSLASGSVVGFAADAFARCARKGSDSFEPAARAARPGAGRPRHDRRLCSRLEHRTRPHAPVGRGARARRARPLPQRHGSSLCTSAPRNGMRR